jgi:hypothetical protein
MSFPILVTGKTADTTPSDSPHGPGRLVETLTTMAWFE